MKVVTSFDSPDLNAGRSETLVDRTAMPGLAILAISRRNSFGIGASETSGAHMIDK